MLFRSVLLLAAGTPVLDEVAPPLAAGMAGPGALLQAAASTSPQAKMGIASIRRMTVVVRPGG